jgi:hypothetical protein
MDIQQAVTIYGIGTRIMTTDGPGTIKAIYEHRVLVMVDEEFRMKARRGKPMNHLPFPTEYWNHKEARTFWGLLYGFHELKLILRPWNSLKPEEIEALDWDNQSCYWAKKSKKGVITYDEESPECFRPTEYSFLCKLKIDLFHLKEQGIAVYE